MRHPRITLGALAIAIAATVGGVTIASASSGSTSAPAAARMPDTLVVGVTGASGPTVRTALTKVQGTDETILVDAKGLPLYTYKLDTPMTSKVTGQLAALWPPLVAAKPTASTTSGSLTTVATGNGRQVAYNGHFLYTFVEDSPGRVTGQGVQDFFVATPSQSAVSPPVANTTSGNSYGY